jgi:hypothetical protein
VPHQFEALVADDMGDVALGAGEEIVDTDEIGAALQQALAQMRAEKARPAGHENSLFKMHARSVQFDFKWRLLPLTQPGRPTTT